MSEWQCHLLSCPGQLIKRRSQLRGPFGDEGIDIICPQVAKTFRLAPFFALYQKPRAAQSGSVDLLLVGGSNSHVIFTALSYNTCPWLLSLHYLLPWLPVSQDYQLPYSSLPANSHAFVAWDILSEHIIREILFHDFIISSSNREIGPCDYVYTWFQLIQCGCKNNWLASEQRVKSVLVMCSTFSL